MYAQYQSTFVGVAAQATANICPSMEVQKIIEHYAEVFQCPRDFIISAVFGVVGTMCGRHVTIFDGKYRNHPNLWICHVAPSGSNKSSPIKALDATDESRRKQTL